MLLPQNIFSNRRKTILKQLLKKKEIPLPQYRHL